MCFINCYGSQIRVIQTAKVFLTRRSKSYISYLFQVTTMSLKGNSYVTIKKMREEGYDIQMKLKTTLPTGLLAIGEGSTFYMLLLENGRLNLRSSILNRIEGVSAGSGLNNSNWQRVS